VEDDDRRLPWRVSPNDGRCLPVPTTMTRLAPPGNDTQDCFDLETFAGVLFTSIATQVAEGIHDSEAAVDLTVSHHRMLAIPYQATAGNQLPGVGFLYSVEVVGRLAGAQVVQGTVYAPLSLHFFLIASAGGQGYELVVDPATQTSAGALNPDRITVVASGPLANAVANELRSVLEAGLREISLPNVTIGQVSLQRPDGTAVEVDLSFPTETVLASMLDSVLPPPAASIDIGYRAILLPVQRTTPGAPIDTTMLSLSSISIADGTVDPPEGLQGVDVSGRETVTRDAASVTIRRLMDKDGKTDRIVKLPPMLVHQPFDLVFLE